MYHQYRGTLYSNIELCSNIEGCSTNAQCITNIEGLGEFGYYQTKTKKLLIKFEKFYATKLISI